MEVPPYFSITNLYKFTISILRTVCLLQDVEVTPVSLAPQSSGEDADNSDSDDHQSTDLRELRCLCLGCGQNTPGYYCTDCWKVIKFFFSYKTIIILLLSG